MDIRTILSDIRVIDTRADLDKRDRFINEIRDEAKARGLSFSIDRKRGKGGHAVLRVGGIATTLPSREIDPKTASKIRNALGLA